APDDERGGAAMVTEFGGSFRQSAYHERSRVRHTRQSIANTYRLARPHSIVVGAFLLQRTLIDDSERAALTGSARLMMGSERGRGARPAVRSSQLDRERMAFMITKRRAAFVSLLVGGSLLALATTDASATPLEEEYISKPTWIPALPGTIQDAHHQWHL